MTNTIDFDFEINTDTDKQGGTGGILPRGYYRLWAEAVEFPVTKDGKGRQASFTFEVQEPTEFKGKKFWAWWTVLHQDEWSHGQYKYGKPMYDRYCRAIGVVPVKGTPIDEIIFKTFVAEVGIQEGSGTDPKTGKPYKDKNQIEKFYYEDDDAKEPIPELGVIGDGTVAPKATAKPASNDNKAPAPKQEAAPAKTPWGAKKAA